MRLGGWLAAAMTCLACLRAVEFWKQALCEEPVPRYEKNLKPGELQTDLAEASATALAMRKFLRDNDCSDVYLDLGTNVGVQPRKLYQPHCYPRALSLSHFTRVFGPISAGRRRRRIPSCIHACMHAHIMWVPRCIHAHIMWVPRCIHAHIMWIP